MTYVLEKLTSEDVRKILLDANESQRRHLRVRHFFENHPDAVWSIDKEKGFYLLHAPKSELMLPGTSFYFYFKNKLFEFTVDGYSGRSVQFSTKPSPNEIEFFQQELIDAFSVHGLSGMPELEPLFTPNFSILDKS